MADVLELTISSEAQAISVMEQAIAGAFENLSVLIKFDGWPSLDIDIEGQRYHSSLPSGVMKALLEYQGAITRAYASISYGRSAKALTEDDRSDVELVFNIAEGSTDTNTPLWETLTKLGEKAIERMTGTNLVVTVLGGALIASGYFGFTHWVDAQAAMQAQGNQSAALVQAIKSNEHLAQLNADVSKSALSLVRAASDADRIEYAGTHLDRAEIEALTVRSREATAPHRIDGKYEIVSLKRFDDRWRVVLSSDASGPFQTDLFHGQSAALCIEEISLAFAKHEQVHLLVLGKYKNDALISATILGSEKSGLLTPDVADATVDED